MTTLSSLANIPGYGAYVAKREINEQQDMQNLQKLGALVQLKQHAERQRQAVVESQRQAQIQAEMAAAPTPEAKRAVAMKYAAPDAILRATQPDKPVSQPAEPPDIQLVNFYNGLPANDPRKPLIKRVLDAKSYKAPPPEKTFPVITTPEGVFERRPEGLVQLKVPGTDKPLTQKPTAAEGLTPENAGKVAMAQQSVDAIQDFRKLVFDKSGSLNKGVVAAMSVPFFAGLPGHTEARTARSKIRNAIEAKLRLETGAAATESEIQRTLARFLPTLADTKESAETKLKDLETFFKTSLSLTKGIPQAQAQGGKVVDFWSLK